MLARAILVPTPSLVLLASLLAVACAGCGGGSNTGDGGASGSCTRVCAAMATCDGGTHWTDCATTCNHVESIIDPNYWPGVSNCLACSSDSMCLEHVAAMVPMSTVQNFLQQLCQWAVMCQSGVTVDQCVSLLEQNGTMNGVSVWNTIGLLSNSSQQCLINCLQHQSCNDVGAATTMCDQTCGLTDIVGSSSSCSCSGSSSCSGHGHFACDSQCNAGCACDPGYVSTGTFECTATCQTTGCGAHGTCSGNFCTCDTGYELGTDHQCHFVAHFTSLGVGGDAICATRDDGRIECFQESGLAGITMPPTDTSYTRVCVDAWVSSYFACGQKTDGSITCWGEDVTGMPMYGAGQLALGCGLSAYCISDPTGVTMCYDHPAGALGTATPPMGLVQLSVYQNSACGRDAAGAVHCWGNQYSGTAPLVLPSDVASGTTDVAIGESGACAVTASGGVSCWGDGAMYVPAGLTMVDHITAATSAYCVHRTDNTVRCWSTMSGADETPMMLMSQPIVQIASTPDATPGNICVLYDTGSFQCSSLFGPTETRLVSPSLL